MKKQFEDYMKVKVSKSTWDNWTKQERDYFLQELDRAKENFQGVTFYKKLFSKARKQFPDKKVTFLFKNFIKVDGKQFYFSEDYRQFYSYTQPY